MTDFMTPEQRHNNMSRIRGKDTAPEVYIRKLLFREGFRYRIHSKQIPGKPDIWMRKYNTAIFVNGCFWHRHQNCKYAYMPKSRIDFWETKFLNNIERDKKNIKDLSDQRKKCVIIWECTVKRMNRDPLYRKKVSALLISYITNMNPHEMILEL